MAYDIPPQLHHDEKIFGPFNLWQVGYLAIAVFIAIGILKFLSVNIQLKAIIAFSVILVGFGFALLDFKKWIWNLFLFLKFKSARMTSIKMKNLISINKIDKDVVVTKHGKVAILEVTPINFMIKNKDEQDSIIKGFQKFLNSLSFPVQIHISSSTINLKKHFKNVKKQAKNLKDLPEKYCRFLDAKLSERTALNRRFFIVIKEQNDIEMQISLCIERLKTLGLNVRRLKTKEMLDYLYNYLNKGYKRKIGQEGDEVMKLIAPEKIHDGLDTIQVNNHFYKILAVKGYPHIVESGFLDKIVSMGDNFDISIHINPHPISETMVQLNKDLQKQKSDLYSDSKKGIINPSLEIKYKSTLKVLEDLQKGKQKLFDVSLYVMCSSKPYNKYKPKWNGENKREKNESKSRCHKRITNLLERKKIIEAKKDVDLLIKKVKAELDAIMLDSGMAFVRMRDGFQSMLPLAIDSLKIKRNITTYGLGAFFPFSSPFFVEEENGALLGLNKNNLPYIKDVFKLSNANGVVLATSGAGKSYFTKLLLSRLFMGGVDVFIIDPQGEYVPITHQYGGEVITISKDSDSIINPLDLMGHDYLEKRLSLMDIFTIMFGELTEVQKAVLDYAIDLTYAKKGINKNSYENRVPPTFDDLFTVLTDLAKDPKNREGVTYLALINRLRMYTKDGVFSFLNKHTNINFDSNFVCFNIGSMPKQVKPVVMYLVLDFIYMRMKKSLNRKLLIVDEAWSILQTAEESSYVFEVVKTCRKFNLGLLMITQDVQDLVSSKAGHAVLANSAYTFLLRQKPAVINNVSKTFNLSSNEKDFLVTADKGFGVLILDNDHQELEIIAAPEEHNLITTNADEILLQNKPVKPKGLNVDIKLDEKSPVHKEIGLSMEDKNFLVNRGFKRCVFVDIGKTKSEAFYVKPLGSESLEHVFLCERLIKHLKALGYSNIERHVSVLPDVIARSPSGIKYAFEIESTKNVRKNWIEEKFTPLRESWGDNLVIIVFNSQKKYAYLKYSDKIHSRNSIIKFLNHEKNIS